MSASGSGGDNDVQKSRRSELPAQQVLTSRLTCDDALLQRWTNDPELMIGPSSGLVRAIGLDLGSSPRIFPSSLESRQRRHASTARGESPRPKREEEPERTKANQHQHPNSASARKEEKRDKGPSASVVNQARRPTRPTLRRQKTSQGEVGGQACESKQMIGFPNSFQAFLAVGAITKIIVGERAPATA